MILPCPNPRENCPYFGNKTRGPLKGSQEHGCYSDTDHIIPRRLGKLSCTTDKEVAYINSPANQQEICRWEHDQKTEDENDFDLLRMLRRIVHPEWAEVEDTHNGFI